MAVRVRLRIRARASGREVVTSALVNSGYEVDEPEILLPRRLVDYLGIAVEAPHARPLIYETPTGLYRLLMTPKAVDVHLDDLCIEVKGVNVAVSEFEREVLLSDKLTSALGIQLLDVAEGVWRHRDDGPEVRRQSVGPEYW
ncbi:hypothetical protein B6U99_02985 [Candidatus Geothermarchaeota archaeon ex4572_27]|nr:MAG: hypothetical protein B6U99_02985 [Candidatus Geothermarchaeota archaeon ex4572_27]